LAYADYDGQREKVCAGKSDGAGRVLRGGSWSNNARNTRVSDRYGGTPDDRNGRLGLRLAQD